MQLFLKFTFILTVVLWCFNISPVFGENSEFSVITPASYSFAEPSIFASMSLIDRLPLPTTEEILHSSGDNGIEVIENVNAIKNALLHKYTDLLSRNVDLARESLLQIKKYTEYLVEFFNCKFVIDLFPDKLKYRKCLSYLNRSRFYLNAVLFIDDYNHIASLVKE